MAPSLDTHQRGMLFCLLSPLSIYSLWCYLRASEAFHPNSLFYTEHPSASPVQPLTFSLSFLGDAVNLLLCVLATAAG